MTDAKRGPRLGDDLLEHQGGHLYDLAHAWLQWAVRSAPHLAVDDLAEVFASLEHPPAGPPIEVAESLARLFHMTYERLAPGFGYETREDTRKFDPESANGRLMTAVCSEIAGSIPTPAGPQLSRYDWDLIVDQLKPHAYVTDHSTKAAELRARIRAHLEQTDV